MPRKSEYLATAPIGGDALAPNNEYWFVYLLPLSAADAFKVGFSCNPLQRIYSFHRRYFERFDCTRSMLLQVNACSAARDVEVEIKRTLASLRVASPKWVLDAAGGHTEWFDAQGLPRAEDILYAHRRADESARIVMTREHLRAELARSTATFELWAIAQAQRLQDDRHAMSLGHRPSCDHTLLRDWLDAYRYFDIPLFNDDCAAFEFVVESSRHLVN